MFLPGSGIVRGGALRKPQVIPCFHRYGFQHRAGNRFPRILQGSLEMDRLNAHKRQAKSFARAAAERQGYRSTQHAIQADGADCSLPLPRVRAPAQIPDSERDPSRCRKMYASPPVIPEPKFSPIGPRTVTTPPVIYSQPCCPSPSTTATAPLLRTAKRSPACPAT